MKSHTQKILFYKSMNNYSSIKSYYSSIKNSLNFGQSGSSNFRRKISFSFSSIPFWESLIFFKPKDKLKVNVHFNQL